MPSKPRDQELEPLPHGAQEAFADYPIPRPRDEFDARFWRELDNRKTRYRGLTGFLRRLVEVEIEGVALWRLAVSTFCGAAFCGLALVLMSAGSPSVSVSLPAPQVADSTEIPTTAPRFARELWTEPAPRPAKVKARESDKKEVSSCVSFVLNWA